MDTNASSHLASDTGILNSVFNSCINFPSHVIVGNGSTLPVLAIGDAFLPHISLRLSNTFISHSVVKNLVSIHQFTCDNSCSVEFDPYGFSVKDLKTNAEILHCNSSGDLYSFLPSTSEPQSAYALSVVAATTLQSMWHRRLGHPCNQELSIL